MSEQHHPRRLRRLDRVFDPAPAYFLTLCTRDRRPVLADSVAFANAKEFAEGSMVRYGAYVDSLVLMPDHAHLIVVISSSSTTTLGQWVKAFKAMVARRQFRWQEGFFDHALRSRESRTEKWDYIRMNPVRAGLAERPEDWPYALRFNSYDGARIEE